MNEQDNIDYDEIGSVVDKIVETAQQQKQTPAVAEQEEKQATSKEPVMDSFDEELICQETEKIEQAAAQKQKSVQQEEATTEKEATTENPITDSFDEEVLCRETEKIEKVATEKKKKRAKQ